jgi:hypothetical protein
MKPQPAPEVPGNTDAEHMSNALRMVLSVPKEAILKAETKLKKAKEKKRKRSARADRSLSRTTKPFRLYDVLSAGPKPSSTEMFAAFPL